MVNLINASKKQIDIILNNCGWRQTKQRVVLLRAIFDGKNKHFCVNSIEQELKDKGNFFSYTTLFENLNTLSTKGYLKRLTVDKQYFYDTDTSDHIHIFNEDENQIYDYSEYTQLHKDLPLPACLDLLKEYSMVINLKKK
ncbi:transcriptional repressor [Alphaproteobacteria bacterium]|nr:transcriptional repressor [Alphaproteobacteria bacterium]